MRPWVRRYSASTCIIRCLRTSSSAFTRPISITTCWVFRDQRITAQQQVDFSRRFGPLQIHVLRNFQLPSHPEVLVISNIIENGQPIGLGDADHAVRDARAAHSYLVPYEELRRRNPWRPALTQAQIDEVQPVVHPVVRTHPETGRQALFVSEHCLAAQVAQQTQQKPPAPAPIAPPPTSFPPARE